MRQLQVSPIGAGPPRRLNQFILCFIFIFVLVFSSSCSFVWAQHTIRRINKCCLVYQSYDIQTLKCVDMDPMEGLINGMDMIKMLDKVNQPIQNPMIFSERSRMINEEIGSDSQIDSFRFNISMPDCDRNDFSMKIFRHHQNRSISAHEGELSISISAMSGYLFWKADEDALTYGVPSSDFCVDKSDGDELVVLTCKSTCDEKKPCIQKCCNPEFVLDDDFEDCVGTKNPWTPNLYRSLDQPLKFNSTIYKQVHYIIGIPECKNGHYSIHSRNDVEDKLYNLVNGSLIGGHKSSKSKFVFPLKTYCVDGISTAEPVISDFRSSDHNIWSELDQIALICFPDHDSESYNLDLERFIIDNESQDQEALWEYAKHIWIFAAIVFLLLAGVGYGFWKCRSTVAV